MSNSSFDSVLAILVAHSPELTDGDRPIDRDSVLTELGIDSLELLSLAAHLEREFDVDIDDLSVASAKTVADIVEIVDSASATR
jgi:acyl carrier protein